MLTERTSRVQEIMGNMARYSSSSKTSKSTTTYNPYQKIKLYKQLVPIDKKLLKDKLKAIHKRSWRVSGCGSRQFSSTGFIKGKALNNWEISRIDLSNRSYTVPKNFKGLKVKHHLSQFPIPSIDTLPNASKEYFRKCEQDYLNKQLQTFQISKTYDNKLKQFRESSRQQFRMTNTKQSNAFGYTATSAERTKTFNNIIF